MHVFYFVKFWKLIIVIFFAISIVVISFIVYNYKQLPEGSVRKLNRQIEPLKLESLKIGDDIPLKPELYKPETPKDVFITSKFYVNIAEPNLGCFLRYCNIQAALIDTMGGWLEAENRGATIDEIFGLDLEENKNIKSVVIIGDRNGKIAGIYPNKRLKDIISILKFYPKLADFNLLKGVDEFGSLKVGSLSPFKPGDSINHLSERSLHQIPKDKKFYIYSLQKNDSGGNYYFCDVAAGCKYLEFADEFFDFMKDLQGWFLANSIEDTKMIKLFGLKPEEVLSGKTSLVVVTDRNGVILALHPGKTLSDTFTILSQMSPDFYRQLNTSASSLSLRHFLEWE